MTELENKQEEELSQLRQEIKLTSSKLLDLTYNENQYVDTLEQYNQQAKKLIMQDQLQEALVYLAQAERLLEYGASCGRTIDRALIILTLHNEACCYYKAADLATASRYIEGVIFNLKSHLDSVDSSPSNSSNSEHPRGSKSNQLTSVALEKKMELVHYYLKYCTVNSQAKNRKLALEAGKKTIQILKALLPDLQQHKVLLSDTSTEAEDIQQLLRKIKPFRQDVLPSDFSKYLAVTRWYLKQWNQDKVVRKISYNLEKHVSNYSISQVIELVPLEYQPDSQNVPNCRSAMRQLLHFSMGYFTISTEYRLMADQLYKKAQERVSSQEYIRANIYHLLSVLHLALYLPCDLLFMKQIVSSYEHHFKTNLMEEVTLDNAEGMLESIVLDKVQQSAPIKKKSMNASLAAKLLKLRSKSKERRVVHTQYEDTELYESKACYKVNQTKMKTKRSTSKQKLLHNKVKKTQKVLNDSLFESSKNLDTISKENKPRAISKKRSTSNAKQLHPHIPHKPRSTSKDSHPVKPLKLPGKVAEMAVDRPKKTNKRFNDEYQLGNAKCTTKKRSNSIASSADLSCSARNTSKARGEKAKKSQKRKVEGGSKQKKLRGCASKEVYSKHYYV